MTMHYAVAFGFIVALSVVIMPFDIISGHLLYLAVIILWLLACAVYWFSPLPNHNDPRIGDKGQYWGFSDSQETEQ